METPLKLIKIMAYLPGAPALLITHMNHLFLLQSGLFTTNRKRKKSGGAAAIRDENTEVQTEGKVRKGRAKETVTVKLTECK